ncbi:MAG: TRAP transporter substrate-binding protein DctP [Desulfuromonadaceae bacterium]|nr:TRAP transporter substrate-binding protein DctP [Desulfuromonadaceae bacterium]
MKRHFVIGFVLLFGALAMGLLSATAGQAQIFKIATVAPEGSDWMVKMRAGAQSISDKTQGRVQLKFYGGGVMGNEMSVLRKIRVGQLQGGAFTGGGLAKISSDMLIYSLPLLARSEEEMAQLRRHLDPLLTDSLNQAGFVCFGFASGGFANLFSERPISKVDDLKGLKLWVPEGDQVSYAVMEGLGLSPVTLPLSDVMTGLQTGLVEVVATSPLGALAFQWYTRVNCMTDMPLAYVYAGLVLDKCSFSRLSAEDQQVVTQVLGAIYREFDQQSRPQNEESLAALQQQGVDRVEPVEGEFQRWSEVADRVARQLSAQGLFPEPLYQRAVELLNDYRQRTTAGSGNSTCR